MLRLFKNRINYKDFADSIYSLPRTSTVERNHSAKPRRVCWERKSAISDRFRFLTVHRLTSYIKHTVILFFLKDFWAQAIAKIKTAPIFPSLNFQTLFLPGWGSIPSLIYVTHQLIPAHEEISRITGILDNTFKLPRSIYKP